MIVKAFFCRSRAFGTIRNCKSFMLQGIEDLLKFTGMASQGMCDALLSARSIVALRSWESKGSKGLMECFPKDECSKLVRWEQSVLFTNLEDFFFHRKNRECICVKFQ